MSNEVHEESSRGGGKSKESKPWVLRADKLLLLFNYSTWCENTMIDDNASTTNSLFRGTLQNHSPEEPNPGNSVYRECSHPISLPLPVACPLASSALS